MTALLIRIEDRNHIMKKILLAAFEPFAGEHVNSSLEMARTFEGVPIAGIEVETLVLPVVHRQAPEIAIDRLLTNKPDTVIMLGTAKGRCSITPERVAINMDHFDIPDNAKNQPQNKSIVEHGPVGYFSSLPIDNIVKQLKEAHIPAAISNSAGLYLCNQLFYSIMHCIEENKLPTRAGFIHLPFLHEQVGNETSPLPSMSRETMTEAISIVIETSIQA